MEFYLLASEQRKNWNKKRARVTTEVYTPKNFKDLIQVTKAKHNKVSLFMGMDDGSYRERIVDATTRQLSREATLKLKCSGCKTMPTVVKKAFFNDDLVLTIETCSRYWDNCELGRSTYASRLMIRKKPQYWPLATLDQIEDRYGSGFDLRMGASCFAICKGPQVTVYQWEDLRAGKYKGKVVNLEEKVSHLSPGCSILELIFEQGDIAFLTSDYRVRMPGYKVAVNISLTIASPLRSLVVLSKTRFAIVTISDYSKKSFVLLCDQNGKVVSRL